MTTYVSLFPLLIFVFFVIKESLLEMERALELNKFLIHAAFNSNLFIKFSLIHSSPILSQNNWVRRKRLFLLENCLQLYNKLCFVDFSESIKEKT